MSPQTSKETMLVIGLVSVSDRASGGVYEDKGIPALQDWLASAITFLPRTNFGVQWSVLMLFMALVGGLRSQALHRLRVEGGRVVAEEPPLQLLRRVRDVRQGPDGLIYLLIDGSGGSVLRLQPPDVR